MSYDEDIQRCSCRSLLGGGNIDHLASTTLCNGSEAVLKGINSKDIYLAMQVYALRRSQQGVRVGPCYESLALRAFVLASTCVSDVFRRTSRQKSLCQTFILGRNDRLSSISHISGSTVSRRQRTLRTLFADGACIQV